MEWITVLTLHGPLDVHLDAVSFEEDLEDSGSSTPDPVVIIGDEVSLERLVTCMVGPSGPMVIICKKMQRDSQNLRYLSAIGLKTIRIRNETYEGMHLEACGDCGNGVQLS